ncbi:MAG: RnfABCDGE type electron transport complex subunit D [Bacteroides sp.]|nr:RnfABCDGE type electron transport complex subunit D [Prevotella sp.]MCM1407922.1 RnfABCDGE type electron transport complex subunit D [Treponema brennaborense]MCM1469664.1 RnfABCDGE type electron transport complex subunit D [Bacteroides sp.]
MEHISEHVTTAPFLHFTPSVHIRSRVLLLSFLPHICMLMYTKSYSSLYILIASAAASFCAELLHCALRRTADIQNGTFLLQGFFIGMFVPAGYHPAAVFFVSFGSLLLIKYAFGGGADSWIHPVCFTVVLLYFLGMAAFPQTDITAEALKRGSLVQNFLTEQNAAGAAFDEKITSWLNTYIFRLFGAEIPAGYISMFWDTHSAVPAFRFNFFTLLSSVFLLTENMIRALVPCLYMIAYAFCVRVFAFVPVTGSYFNGDMLFALLSGGTLFSAFFLLDWQGTVPLGAAGKVLYACSAGCAAFLFCGCGASSVGCVFTILVMNIFSVFIQFLEDRLYEARMAKRRMNKEVLYV